MFKLYTTIADRWQTHFSIPSWRGVITRVSRRSWDLEYFLEDDMLILKEAPAKKFKLSIQTFITE